MRDSNINKYYVCINIDKNKNDFFVFFNDDYNIAQNFYKKKYKGSIYHISENKFYEINFINFVDKKFTYNEIIKILKDYDLEELVI